MNSLAELLALPRPVLALAPMQDVTDRAFWELMSRYGGADVYYTEYFRVYETSRLDKNILVSLTQNPTGRPAIAQMIGNDIPALVRTARELECYDIAAVDLNLGCPAPVVYRKCAGGGLLRDLPRVDAILGALREAIRGPFTVKTRLGFDDEATIEALIPLIVRHGIDLLTVHGRTVTQMYRDGVRYDLIAEVARAVPCPVLANGNVSSAPVALQILEETGVRGVMIGRGAVRNPWMFSQIRELFAEGRLRLPRGRDVLAYMHALYEAVCAPDVTELQQVQKMKKYANFVGMGVDPSGRFLHDIRRATRRDEFFRICATAMDHDDLMPLEVFRTASAE
jgi:nifR3 family TIM-barrel protein